MGRFCECCRGWDRLRIHLLTILIIIAFTASIITVTTCRFWQISGGYYQQAGGLFTYNYRFEECRSYKNASIDIKFDPSTVAARAFAVLAIIFSGISLIMILSLQCIPQHSNKSWKVLAGFLLFSCFSQCMTFLIFKQINDIELQSYPTDVQYGLGLTGIVTCIAVGIYLFTGIFVLITIKPSTTVYQCRLIGTFIKAMGIKMNVTIKKNILQSIRNNTKLIQVIVLIMSIITFLLSLTIILDCKLITVQYEGSGLTVYFGLFLYHYKPTDTCRKYERRAEENVRTAGASARAFSIMVVFLGGILMILLWLKLILNIPSSIFKKVIYIIALLCGIFQSLSLLGYKQVLDNSCASELAECSIGQDTILVIIASLMYFIITVAVICFDGIIENDEEEPTSSGTNNNDVNNKKNDDILVDDTNNNVDYEIGVEEPDNNNKREQEEVQA